MEEFTVKNLLKYWLKLWPVTMILLVLGVIVGIYTTKDIVPSYEATAEVLVYNTAKNVAAGDYLAIVESDKVSHDEVPETCGIEASQSGNVVTIVASCSNTNDDVVNILDDVVMAFEHEVMTFYHDANVSFYKTKNIEDADTVVHTSRAKKMVIPVAAALAMSGVVAFVGLDFKTTKKKQ